MLDRTGVPLEPFYMYGALVPSTGTLGLLKQGLEQPGQVSSKRRRGGARGALLTTCLARARRSPNWPAPLSNLPPAPSVHVWAQECVASGDAVLEFYGIHSSYGFYVGVLAAYLAVLHLLTFLGLWRGSRRLNTSR